MKAILEVEFDKNIMFDQKTIDEDFGGSWLKAMQWLYKEDSIGIFNNNPKLVGIEVDK